MKSDLSTTVNESNAREAFEAAMLAADSAMPHFEGRGIIIAAGGPYTESAYVVVRLLRHYGVKLPIEIWHAGHDEISDWAREAFGPHGVSFHDVMKHCPDRPLKQMRGWPIKLAALMHSSLRELIFIDADCFPVCNIEFLFETEEYLQKKALFWPDNKRHKLLPGEKIWQYTGLSYQGDTEFETGLLVVDKAACWKEMNLALWMNLNSDFWYQHVLGDKDTFYLSWKKLQRSYFLAPSCRRISAILTRHFWLDGKHLVDHRTGTSKYALPYTRGILKCYLTPYKGRSASKNLIDELIQRFVTRNFTLHVRFLEDIKSYAPRNSTVD
jgi:hypothetical protein